MLRVLAGDLSATFNIDGLHLERYVKRQTDVVRSLSDQLLLHDQILIPTQDYLTAAGLVRILGEHNVLKLLEEDRLRFVRMRGAFGYARGTGLDGRLVAFNDPTNRLAASSSIRASIEAGVGAIKTELHDRNRLLQLLHAQSVELELSSVVDATHRDAYADLSQTVLWKKQYRNRNPDLLELPRVPKMGVRVLGPTTDVSNSAVDACLALGLMNIELYLAKQYDCASSSTGSPIGDCVSLKIPRLMHHRGARPALWNFLEVTAVPDISGPLLANSAEMTKFIDLTSRADAQAFRQWFHDNAHLTDKELLKAYINVLHDTPWIQSKVGRALRMVTSLAIGGIGEFALEAAASVVDSFVVDKFARSRNAKFFMEDFRKFSGRIKSSE
ncbi:hypothetical protein BH10PSE6_BH10PSE6_24710 [soil metagenome]